jgi:mannose-6-phosphate isomerase-like protein (cupin superfamily)
VRPVVRRAHEIRWSEPPGHHRSALSKLLVHPRNTDTQCLDVRLSCYQPGGYAAPHAHREAENVFLVLKGRGIMELDEAQHPIEPGTVVFVPPGVTHAIYNTGDGPLVFVFVASPPRDMPAVD